VCFSTSDVSVARVPSYSGLRYDFAPPTWGEIYRENEYKPSENHLFTKHELRGKDVI
jgi:hypothetical protein